MAGYSPLLIRPCLEFWWRHRSQQTHWSPMPNKNPDNVIDWYPMIPSQMGVKHLTPYENLWYCNQDSLLYEKPVTFWIDTMIIAKWKTEWRNQHTVLYPQAWAIFRKSKESLKPLVGWPPTESWQPLLIRMCLKLATSDCPMVAIAPMCIRTAPSPSKQKIYNKGNNERGSKGLCYH